MFGLIMTAFRWICYMLHDIAYKRGLQVHGTYMILAIRPTQQYPSSLPTTAVLDSKHNPRTVHMRDGVVPFRMRLIICGP